jgi:hypothetical protein
MIPGHRADEVLDDLALDINEVAIFSAFFRSRWDSNPWR